MKSWAWAAKSVWFARAKNGTIDIVLNSSNGLMRVYALGRFLCENSRALSKPSKQLRVLAK